MSEIMEILGTAWTSRSVGWMALVAARIVLSITLLVRLVPINSALKTAMLAIVLRVTLTSTFPRLCSEYNKFVTLLCNLERLGRTSAVLSTLRFTDCVWLETILGEFRTARL